jgi:hypothetical protein
MPGSATRQIDITAPYKMGLQTFYIIKKRRKKLCVRIQIGRYSV